MYKETGYMTLQEVVQQMGDEDVAFREDGSFECFWGDEWKLTFRKIDTDKEDQFVCKSDFEMKWKLHKKIQYVTFEEAIKALKNGIAVTYHNDGIIHEITPKQAEEWNIRSLSINDHGLLHLYDGEWTIED